ncbi:MAG: flagellar hook-associated protein FlgL, partial [Bdellovibrionales bacterium]|nr:flagellar hook-associated protein FlgL [Bdellovibrionales bacterium]
MAFRVTNNLTTETFITQILNNRFNLAETQEEISSGYKVLDASDDPGRAGTVVNLISTSQRIDRHLQRITFATNFLEAQENAVQSANNTMMRLQELATQAANGTIAVDVRAQIADEVFQLRDNLAALANSRNQGLYVFGGRDDGGTAPFSFDPAYFNEPPTAGLPEKGHWVFDNASIGKSLTRDVNISDTESIRINSPA